MRRLSLAGTDLEWGCEPGDTVLRSALRAGIGLPYSCNTGACGNCRVELVSGALAHLRENPPALTDKDRARGRWLGCQATPLGDCVLKARPDPAAALPPRPRRREGVLVSATPLSHDIAEFAFRVTGDPAFLPGQYALLSLPGVEGPRVYSFSNLPEDGVWSFVVRQVPGGAATPVLFGLRPGDAVALDGPYGLAYLRQDSSRDLLLIAGGSGLSPILSLARGALARTGARVHAYFGGRGPRDLDAAAPLAAMNPARLSLVTAVSEPPESWTGRSGFIHEVAVADLGAALPGMEVYLAGPPLMAQATQLALHVAGVPRAQVHFDEFL